MVFIISHEEESWIHKEIDDSKVGAGNVQDKPRAFYNTRKKKAIKNNEDMSKVLVPGTSGCYQGVMKCSKTDGNTPNRHRSHLKEYPASQLWDDLSFKINNDSNRL